MYWYDAVSDEMSSGLNDGGATCRIAVDLRRFPLPRSSTRLRILPLVAGGVRMRTNGLLAVHLHRFDQDGVTGSALSEPAGRVFSKRKCVVDERISRVVSADVECCATLQPGHSVPFQNS